MRIFSAAVLASVVLLAGCVTSEVVKRAEPGSKAALDVVASGDELATVVFFRPERAEGGMVTFNVLEDDQVLGKLSSGSYFVARVPPGKHTFVARYKAQSALEVRAAPGRTYYVRITILMIKGKPQPSLSDAETFDAIKPKLRLLTAVRPVHRDRIAADT